MAPAVMSDATIAARGQKEHLVLKRVRAQWPAMAKDDGLSLTPVVEINFCSVFGRDRIHKLIPFLRSCLACDVGGLADLLCSVTHYSSPFSSLLRFPPNT